MIPYEDLCRSLNIYNRKLRGEDVPEEAYQEQDVEDDFDIVESADMDIVESADMDIVESADMDIVESTDMDAEAVGAEMDGQYAEAVPDVTAETAIPPADFGGYDPPQQQQYQEGYEQAPEQQPGTYPDDQDPNRQQ